MACPNPTFEKHLRLYPTAMLEQSRPTLRRMASRGYWGPSTLQAVERELWARTRDGEALDHLVALENELTSLRAKQDALITPAHSHARHFLVEQGRRNRSVHG
jgi:hypothetical protein